MIINTERLPGSKIKLSCNVDAERIKRGIAVCKLAKEGFASTSKDEEFFKANFEEIVNNIMESVLREVIEVQNLKPVGDPFVKLIDDVVYYDKGFNFTIEMEVFPEIVLGEYKNVMVEKAPVIVSNKEIRDYIQASLSSLAKNEAVDDAVEMEDTVLIDFEGFVDGVPFEGGKAEKYSLVIGSHSFIPGFEEQIVGMKAGESKDITVKFPERYVESLAGKEAVFKIYLHGVERKMYPEFSDKTVEMLKIEGVDTREKYVAMVRAELREKRKVESEEKFLADYVTAIISSSKIDLPETFIRERIDLQIKKLKEQSEQYSLPVELLLQYIGVNTMDEYVERIREDVILSLKAEFVFDQIAKEEGFTVSDEEVERAVSADKSGKPVEKEGVRALLILQKARDFVRSLAETKMKEIDKEKTLYMFDGNGVKVECTVLFTYENQESGARYVVFLDNDAGEIGAAKYGKSGEFEQIESEREWNMIQELLDQYSQEKMQK